MDIKTFICIAIIISTFSCCNNKENKSDIDEIQNFETMPNSQWNDSNNTIESDTNEEQYITRGIIETDSTVWIRANIKKEHIIFGYQMPSIKSNKLFLFSVFTKEVEENPSNCKYGSYYETTDMDNKGISLKYIADTINFRKLEIIRDSTVIDHAFVESKWLKIEIE